MDDLLDSIRKIIAEDYSERSLETKPEERAREPEAPDPDPGPEPDDAIARAFGDALDAADDVAVATIDPGPAAAPEPIEADFGTKAALSEAIAVSAAAVVPDVAREAMRAAPVSDPARAAVSDSVRKTGRTAAEKIANLRATRESEPPSNVVPLDRDHRTPDMTDTAADPQPEPTGGNAFRRAAPQPRPEGSEEGLTSARTRQSVGTQFDQLSRTIINSNPRTLEDLVRDMVRPLLREWLEANLGDIVERQVRQEIDRVSARGR
ncbi:MAG: DUF2497 domain-containing protein [Pseudomonadota bacterium]